MCDLLAISANWTYIRIPGIQRSAKEMGSLFLWSCSRPFVRSFFRPKQVGAIKLLAALSDDVLVHH